jgi:acyl-[acyl-carrier-protein] desaturase
MTAADPRRVQTQLIHELAPVVEQNLNRHLKLAKDWQPHDYVPWSRGRDFAFLGGQDWCSEQSELDASVRTAMIVNLLTEDNLPSYHREIATRFGRDGAWGNWVGRWTAEESRHAIALRDYLIVTRAVDPVQLETLRMQHMSCGYDSGDKTMLQAATYVSFQELATRVSHRNTGRAANCSLAEQLLARISTDENLHMVFYRNLCAAAFDLMPDITMQAVRDEVMGFAMPGAGMPDFTRNSVIIAKAGIYDLRLHYDEVLAPVIRFWRVFERDDLGPDGEQAREELAAFLANLDAQANRFVEQRDRALERERRRAEKSAGDPAAPAAPRVNADPMRSATIGV